MGVLDCGGSLLAEYAHQKDLAVAGELLCVVLMGFDEAFR